MSKQFLKNYIIIAVPLVIAGAVALYCLLPQPFSGKAKYDLYAEWDPPNINALPATPEAGLIRYGKELIINTARYLGPKGSVAAMSNGMNCENCHLEAGTRLNANSFAMVASTYPKFRERSGQVESVEFRINDCMERSLNGKKLDSLSKEMQAMKAYIQWLGKDVQKTAKLRGMGIPEPTLLVRAASADKGEQVYQRLCTRCHAADGQGLFKPDSSAYFYPPLWGPHSYNTAAGMNRISRIAGFVKYNMPFEAVQEAPQLTDEEAWDVAAYISSQDRPQKLFSSDWPKLASKPFDFPFGPYTDSFPELRHKYGPFGDIKRAKAAVGK